jgi:N-acyl-D-aspartate/D-glutamate deacylase
MGNCGFSLAPVRANQEELVLSNLEHAEGIPASAMLQGIDWSWEGFEEYLKAVDGRPKAINYATQVGHSALRTFAMGERAFTHEATDDDLVLMERTLRDALHAGAVGFTTSIRPSHVTMDGRPIASRKASWNEIRRLVHVLGSEGAGVFELAQENEPDYARVQRLAIDSGAPITFGLRPSQEIDVQTQLDFFDLTAEAGGRIFGQVRSAPDLVVYSFRAEMPYDKLPGWSTFRSLPVEEQVEGIKDPQLSERLVEALTVAYLDGDRSGVTGPRNPLPALDTVMVVQAGKKPVNIEQLAHERGVPPTELVVALAKETDLAQIFTRCHGWSDEDLLAGLRHPRTIMTFTDSGAHVTFHSGAEFHTTLLTKWVRDKEAFTLEEAIRMISLMPCLNWQLADRGLLRVGMIADINVFDLEHMELQAPTVETDLPGGAYRVKLKADGYVASVVSGVPTFDRGVHTGDYPGRLIRGPLARIPQKS